MTLRNQEYILINVFKKKCKGYRDGFEKDKINIPKLRFMLIIDGVKRAEYSQWIQRC